MPIEAQLISRQQRGDIIHYFVEWRGAKLDIVESNNPREQMDPKDGRGNFVLTTGKKWPSGVEVMGPCKTNEDCVVKSFGTALTLK